MRSAFWLVSGILIYSVLFISTHDYNSQNLTLTDFIDVGSSKNTASHGYEANYSSRLGCHVMPYSSGEVRRYCGVAFNTREYFSFQAEAGRPVLLSKVVDTASVDIELEVFVNGKPAGVWSYLPGAASKAGWEEENFSINGELIKYGRNAIELKVVKATPDVNSFEYRIYSEHTSIGYAIYYIREYLIVFVKLAAIAAAFLLVKVLLESNQLLKKLDIFNRMEFKIFLFFFIVYGIFAQNHTLSNDGSRLALTSAIVENRSFIIDAFYSYTGGVDYAMYNGHYYSDKPFGTAFLAVPPYLLAKLTGMTDYAERLFIIELFTSVLIASLGCVIVYLFAKEFTKDEITRVLTTLTYGLGTLLFPWSTVFTNHPVTATLLLASFYIAYLVKKRRVRNDNLYIAGALAGMSSTMEYQGILFAIPIGLYVLWNNRLKSFKFLVAAALLTSTLFAFNYVVFNEALTFGTHKYQGFFKHHNQENTFYGVGMPKKEVAINLLFRTPRGLLIYNPVLVLSLVGFVLLMKSRFRAEALTAMGVFIIVFLFNAGYMMWDGGWSFGPRFLIPGIPFLALMLIPVFDVKALRILGLILLVPSVMAMLVGSFVDVLYGGTDPLMQEIGNAVSGQFTAFGARTYYFSYMMSNGIGVLKALAFPMIAIALIFRRELKESIKLAWAWKPER